MNYVPEFVVLYEIVPYIILALENKTIRIAVKDYRKDGKKKTDIIKRYGKMEDWNTSEVTDMSRLFADWDTSKVSQSDVYFNEDISDWDTSKVTTMKHMFYCAVRFNQPIGKWDVSRVADMEDMFYFA